jgi:hypothetical protein
MFKNLKKNLDDLSKSVTESGLAIGASFVGEVFIDGFVGTFLPGIPAVVLSYKQKRMERNIFEIISQLSNKIDILQNRWDTLHVSRKTLIKEKFAGLICDYVIDEKETSKIEFMANGFVSILQLDETISESKIIEYYDILDRLRHIDMIILLDYYTGNYDDTLDGYDKYLESRNLSHGDYEYIKNKLEDLRLLESDRLIKHEEFFSELAKRFGKYNQRSPQVPNHFSYFITSLGKEVVYFFTLISENK